MGGRDEVVLGTIEIRSNAATVGKNTSAPFYSRALIIITPTIRTITVAPAQFEPDFAKSAQFERNVQKRFFFSHNAK